MIPIAPLSFKKTESGDFSLGGITFEALAKQFGTPLYVLCEETIRSRCRTFRSVLDRSYEDFEVLYAGKANLTTGLLNLLAEEEMGLDVVSGGELYTALKSNISTNRIYFHGNNKSVDELTLAIQNDVRLVVDNFQEIDNIASILNTLKSKKARILIRIKPEIEAATHAHIQTGQLKSKFGFGKEEVFPLLDKVKKNTQIEVLGLHSHIGSQIFDEQPYLNLVDCMAQWVADVREKAGITVQELNIGGGFGIKYLESDQPFELEVFIKKMVERLKTVCAEKKVQLPKLLIEPGRSIIGTAGVTLYRIGVIKDIPGIKSYLFIDGGMADNPRPIMYEAEYTFSLGKEKKSAVQPYSIAGKFCESGDILGEDIELPSPEVGDLLVTYGTGAYNYVMASNYNRFCRPAMVLVGQGKASLLVRRETYADLIRFDAG